MLRRLHVLGNRLDRTHPCDERIKSLFQQASYLHCTHSASPFAEQNRSFHDLRRESTTNPSSNDGPAFLPRIQRDPSGSGSPPLKPAGGKIATRT